MVGLPGSLWCCWRLSTLWPGRRATSTWRRSVWWGVCRGLQNSKLVVVSTHGRVHIKDIVVRYIITYYPEFKRNAIEELFALDKALKVSRLSASMSLIATELCGNEFIRSVVASSPIFVRHVMPVMFEGGVTNDRESDSREILMRAIDVCEVNEGQRFSVQCRIVDGRKDYVSKDIEVFVGSYFESKGGIPTFSDREIMNFDIDIISVLITDEAYYLGYSKASENLNSHSDEHRVLSRNSVEICRAENKLKEAICKFGLSLRGSGCALDVGAAPGGWTKVLADYGFQVVAVDPGELHESLRGHKHIVHYRDRVENLAFDNQFDVIVNDMNVDPQITSQIMCDLSVNLVENGMAVITLKLPFMDVNRSLRESLALLNGKYDILAMKNLSHNRREITALLRKKEAAI